METYIGIFIKLEYQLRKRNYKIRSCTNSDCSVNNTDLPSTYKFCNKCGSEVGEVTKLSGDEEWGWFSAYEKHGLEDDIFSVIDSFPDVELLTVNHHHTGFCDDYRSDERVATLSDIQEYNDRIDQFKEHYKEALDVLDKEEFEYTIECGVIVYDY